MGDGAPEQQIAEATSRLAAELAGLPGVLIDPKRFALAIHYRLADPADLPRIERAVDEAAAAFPALRKSRGKKVFELRPALDWHKGATLGWVLDRWTETGGSDAASPRPWLPLYLGDDTTDEDAFAAAAERGGIGILVADEPRATAARYRLRDPQEVRRFLDRLAELPDPGGAGSDSGAGGDSEAGSGGGGAG